MCFEDYAQALRNILEGLYDVDLVNKGQELKAYVEESVTARGNLEEKFLMAFAEVSRDTRLRKSGGI